MRRIPALGGLVTALLMVVLLALATHAQTAKRFDMGSTTSPLERGWLQVTGATRYTTLAGYGWVKPLTRVFVRPTLIPEVKTDLSRAVILDGLTGTADGVFQVDLPAGQYQCVVYLGDPGTLRAVTPREKLDVLVNGAAVALDTWARTATRKARFDTNARGGVKRVRFLASPKNGSIQITFHCDGTGTSINSVAGIEVYPHTAPPIAFDHSTQTLKASTTHAAALAAALKAFNAHDYAKARKELDAVKDPLARAWGYAWWIGWLKGQAVDADETLLATTRTLLEGLNKPDDPSVAVLLQDVKDFQRGLHMNRLRGYPSSYDPESLNNIVYNLAAAVALFEQMDDDVLGAANAAKPECPLYPKARFLIARNMYSRYTGVGDPRQPWAAMWLGILKNDFVPSLKLFPRAANVELFTFFATRYGIDGGIIKNWRGPRSLPTYQPAQAWWASYTEFTDPKSAPRWAAHMRAYQNQFRNCGDWWMATRLHQGEIGGGGGDDVEGGGLLSLPTIAHTEPGNPLELGIKACLEKVLFGREVNQAEGYFANCGDVEHAGEFTSYPLFALMPTNFGRPSHIEFATRSIRNMDEKADLVPWTQLLAANRRHFKSYVFGATKVCGPARDIPCNIRAIIPGFFLMDYNNAPRVKQLFDELARAWAADAMSTASGKPKGIPPVSVSLTNPPVFGTGGKWWTNGGYYDLPKGGEYFSYLYALLLAAYHNSTAQDRHLLLEPILHSGLLQYQNHLGQLKNTLAGGDKWTADQLRGPIANVVAEAYPALAQDPTLKLTPTDLGKLSTVIAGYAAPYLQYLHQGGTGAKNKSVLEGAFERARVWMRWFWPLCTSSVSYTDRIYVFSQNSHQLLYSAMMGGAFGVNPTYVLSWVNPEPKKGELDMAALVNGYGNNSLDVLLFNFGAKRDMAFRLWRRLSFGKYTVRVGHDANHDDRIDGTPHTSFMLAYDARGMTVTLPDVPAGTLQKIELRKTAALPGAGALLPDLAVSDDDVRVVAGGQVEVVVHNLGSAPAAGGVLELREGTRKLHGQAIPTLAAPLDLTPRSVKVRAPYRPLQPGAPLTVRVALAAAVKEVTLFNNETTVAPTLPAATLALANKTGMTTFDVVFASPHDAGKYYAVVPSLSGSSPGTKLPPSLTLPLNWDQLSGMALTTGLGLFQDALGNLDTRGKGVLKVRVPADPKLRGVTVYFAGAAFTAEAFRVVAGPVVVKL